MGRPAKVKVDYFPHVTHTGKTMAILEARWGNDGYAFWFKLLELLGDSNDFSFNCNSSSEWEYLLSKTRVTENAATAILGKLAEIDAIDSELWAKKIIWSDNFVRNLQPVFERRKSAAPQKPALCMQNSVQNENQTSFCDENSNEPVLFPTESDKVKESKAEEIKAKESEGEEKRAGAREDLPVSVLEKSEPKKKQRKSTDPSCPSRMREGALRQADTVYLRPDEMGWLCQDFGENGAKRIIALLDAYKTNHPGKCREYRDDYKVITSWVISRYLEERASRSQSGRAKTFIDKLADMAREDKE